MLDKLDSNGNIIKSAFQDVYEEFRRRKSVSLDAMPISNEINKEEKSVSFEPPRIDTPTPAELVKGTVKPIPIKQEPDPIKSTPIKPIPIEPEKKQKKESEPNKQTSIKQENSFKPVKDPSNGSLKSVKIGTLSRKSEALQDSTEDMRVSLKTNSLI